MPADPIKSKHVRSMLNIHLSKQAFVKEDAHGEIVWWNGSPFHRGEKPPLLPQFRYSRHIREHYNEEAEHMCHESVPIEDFRNAVYDGSGCDDFTDESQPGHVYHTELLNLMDLLEWRFADVDEEITEAFTLPVIDDKRRMSLFVPSFLALIRHLAIDESRDFVFIIRTFGSDIPRMIPAFNLIAEGKHPLLPKPGCIHPPSWVGSLCRRGRSDHRLVLSPPQNSSQTSIIDGNANILSFFDSLPSRSVIMINDDYEDWKSHSWNPVFGKPMFLDPENACMHFLFDDNVNMNPKDSIAAVWLKKNDNTGAPHFVPLPLHTRAGLATIGTVLLQANLFKSITDENAFISELKRAEKRYCSLKERMHSESSSFTSSHS